MDEPRLTAKQAKGLAALLDGANIQDAAAAAGVNRKTLGRWLTEPLFWKTYQLNSRRGLELAARRLAGNLDGAVERPRVVWTPSAALLASVMAKAERALRGDAAEPADWTNARPDVVAHREGLLEWLERQQD